MEFVELTAKEYESYAIKSKYNNFLNSRQLLESKRKNGWDVGYVGIKKNGVIVGAAGFFLVPTLRRFYYAYAIRGPLLDYEDEEQVAFFIKNIKSYFNKKRVIYFKMDPLVLCREYSHKCTVIDDGVDNQKIVDFLKNNGFKHQGFTVGFEKNEQCRFVMVLDLIDQNEDTVFKNFDKLRKRCVRKSQKDYIEIVENADEGLDEFLDIMLETERKKGIDHISKNFYVQQQKAFGVEKAKIVLCKIDLNRYEVELSNEMKKMDSIALEKRKLNYEEQYEVIQKKIIELKLLKSKYGSKVAIAGGYFVDYGNEIVYVSGGSRSDFTKFCGSYALQWYMICESLNSKKERYNFYGTSGIFEKSADDYGVFEFKKGFYAKPEEYIGVFHLPIIPFLYRLAMGKNK